MAGFVSTWDVGTVSVLRVVLWLFIAVHILYFTAFGQYIMSNGGQNISCYQQVFGISCSGRIFVERQTYKN